eukprot:gene10283-9646_t
MPYEKRICELLKVQREKRALRFAKRRLSAGREIMSNYMRKQMRKK